MTRGQEETAEAVVIRVDAHVVWRASRGVAAWVASCDALGLCAQAATWEELTRSIGEVIRFLYLRATEARQAALERRLAQDLFPGARR